MKRSSHPLLFVLFMMAIMLLGQYDLQGQRTSTRSRRQPVIEKETTSLADKLNFEIKFGNLGFWGNVLGIAAKGNVGYKFFDKMSAGVGVKTNFQYINYPSGIQDQSYLEYGGFGYLRGKISKSIYLQGEYGINSLAYSNGNRSIVGAPLVGGGYMNSGDKWSYGAEILFNIDNRAQDSYGVIEYWINFSYKF